MHAAPVARPSAPIGHENRVGRCLPAAELRHVPACLCGRKRKKLNIKKLFPLSRTGTGAHHSTTRPRVSRVLHAHHHLCPVVNTLYRHLSPDLRISTRRGGHVSRMCVWASCSALCPCCPPMPTSPDLERAAPAAAAAFADPESPAAAS